MEFKYNVYVKRQTSVLAECIKDDIILQEPRCIVRIFKYQLWETYPAIIDYITGVRRDGYLLTRNNVTILMKEDEFNSYFRIYTP